MPRLSIVIVSWNVRDLLRECVASIKGQHLEPAPEIIVVDNLSTDGTVEMLRREHPDVHVIEPGENTGFSRGNNLGIRVSGGEYILLLNPDTRVLDDALARLVAYLDQHPEVGVVGPQLLNADGSVQSSRRRFPTLWTAFFESTWLQPIAPPPLLDRFYMRDQDDTATCEVDWLQGAALLVRRKAIEQCGLLDEGFFMYSEELDWQRRIKAAGWRIVYYPGAQIIHYGGKSSEQVVALLHIHFQTSKIRYFRKYHGWLAADALRGFLLLSYAVQLALEAAKGLIGHKRPLRRARVQAYWQVLCSGLKG
ncbi:MAG: glycosyltransferase family 2 protein [Anaerolineae bacterium]